MITFEGKMIMCGPVFETETVDCEGCNIICSKRGGEPVQCPNEEGGQKNDSYNR